MLSMGSSKTARPTAKAIVSQRVRRRYRSRTSSQRKEFQSSKAVPSDERAASVFEFESLSAIRATSVFLRPSCHKEGTNHEAVASRAQLMRKTSAAEM